MTDLQDAAIREQQIRERQQTRGLLTFDDAVFLLGVIDTLRQQLHALEQERDEQDKHIAWVEARDAEIATQANNLQADVSRLTTALAEQEKAAEKARVAGWCDACCGTGKPADGGACMCNGTGLASMAVTYLRERLLKREQEIERLRAVASESNAVCVCGCPITEHENYGEDGETCEHDTHECIRTSKAVYAIVHRLERQIAALTEFTESVMITFRNYYAQAISRQAVEDKLAEWLKLREAALRPAAPRRGGRIVSDSSYMVKIKTKDFGLRRARSTEGGGDHG